MSSALSASLSTPTVAIKRARGNRLAAWPFSPVPPGPSALARSTHSVVKRRAGTRPDHDVVLEHATISRHHPPEDLHTLPREYCLVQPEEG